MSGFVGPEAQLGPYIFHFLLVSFVISLSTASIRLRDPRSIAKETFRFFAWIVIGIFLFSATVFFLEWLFIRPLV
jgi:hypothetical protein